MHPMPKTIALAMLLAAAAPAAVVAQLPPARPASAALTQPVSLDRVVGIVGDQPITLFDVQDRLLEKQQAGQIRALPTDSAGLADLMRATLNEMIDEELLLIKAKELKVEVPENELTQQVDKQLKDTRGRFNSEGEFRAELTRAGLGTPEEYRKFLLDKMRRYQTISRTMQKLQQDNKIIPANVTEQDVKEAFERSKAELPRRPASVTFRQIVIAPKASEAAKSIARAKAESLLAEIKRGADFEKIAKRESMDESTKDIGGDLGWRRRGDYVPEFDRWVFSGALPPGELSPVVETPFGFHIIRIDRVNGPEVKARHILIRPKLDSADVARAQKEADSVAAKLRAGGSFDSLAKGHHDYASREEVGLLPPISRDSLPESYRNAFVAKKVNDVVTFPIPDPVRGVPKIVVAQIVAVDEGGERTLTEMREMIRSRLAEEGGARRFLDGLRKQTYVSIRL